MPKQYTCLAEVTVGAGGVATVSITSIPSTFTDLCLKISAANTSASWIDWQIRFNSSSTSYTQRILYMNGSVVGNSIDNAIQPRTPLSTDSWANVELYVPNYAGSNHKSTSQDIAWSRNTTGAGSSFTGIEAALWASSSAITSIQIVPTSANIAQHSTFYLYGITNS